MTRKGRKSRSHHKIGDVTIKEFADSQTSTNRLKKGNLEVREKIFDMTSNDFPDDEDKRVTANCKLIKSDPINSTDDHAFSSYPPDIWFLIGQYIQPEDVGRFSSICRTTASICGSPGFWFSMYKRYYKKGSERIIPVRLQPDCMVRLQNLRACVIRSLFFTYKPFVERLPSLAKQDFHNLKSFWVIGYWVDTDKSDWLFCYKLRNNAPVPSDRILKEGSSFKNQRDIFSNSEQGCKLLVVTAKKILSIARIER